MASPTSDAQTVALFDGHVQWLLRIADTPLILAQRLGEWVGAAPTLEEEMALANFALDLLGQATLLLEHAAVLDAQGRSADDFAFLREEHEYQNLLLAELPIGDFADTIVRQLLYEAWAAELWASLTNSADAQVAGIAAKALKETAYHVDHCADWLLRLADGTDESRARVDAAIERVWAYAGECLLDDQLDERAAKAGVAALPSTLEAGWRARIAAIWAHAELDVPGDVWWQRGGRDGRHSEHMGRLLAVLQVLQRQHPGAVW